MIRTVLISYPPGQDYVVTLLQQSFQSTSAAEIEWRIITSRDETDGIIDVEWSDYDHILWDDTGTLRNSYMIRKALIRKNHLAHTISLYLAKNPLSILRQAAPRAYSFNLSFPDELDELLLDDLYELNHAFEEDADKEPRDQRWWILKAALADRGNGIRLFSNREMLEEIFEEFQVESSDEEDEDDSEGETEKGPSHGQGKETAVNASQMREWTIQEYISKPLLLDPVLGSTVGRKFHLRVYVVAVSALSVYVHHPYLALFAPTPYDFPPTRGDDGTVDLSSHLTNTCIQSVDDEQPPALVVSTWQSLAEHVILGEGAYAGEKLGEERIRKVENDVGEIVSETFRAGISSGSGFQVLPNSFEIFGCDFLVDETLQVSLLEINACPDFSQTGADLQSVIANLFESTIKTAVLPYFSSSSDGIADDTATLSLDNSLKRVLKMKVSRAW